MIGFGPNDETAKRDDRHAPAKSTILHYCTIAIRFISLNSSTSRAVTMRLLTHNSLRCNAKDVTHGYPLKLKVDDMQVLYIVALK